MVVGSASTVGCEEGSVAVGAGDAIEPGDTLPHAEIAKIMPITATALAHRAISSSEPPASIGAATVPIFPYDAESPANAQTIGES